MRSVPPTDRGPRTATRLVTTSPRRRRRPTHRTGPLAPAGPAWCSCQEQATRVEAVAPRPRARGQLCRLRRSAAPHDGAPTRRSQSCSLPARCEHCVHDAGLPHLGPDMDRAQPPLTEQAAAPADLGTIAGEHAGTANVLASVRGNGAATADRSKDGGLREPRAVAARAAPQRDARREGDANRRSGRIRYHQPHAGDGSPSPNAAPTSAAFEKRLSRDQLAIERRPGPSHQRQRTTGRCPDNHRCGTLLAAIDRAAP